MRKVEVDHDASRPMLRNLEVPGATQAGGPSSSVGSRRSLPSVRRIDSLPGPSDQRELIFAHRGVACLELLIA